jgi:sugar/nucleoside kinase (ribokinase family)
MDVATIGHVSIDLIKSKGEERRQLGGAAIYSAMASKIFSRTGVVSRVGRDFPWGFYKVLRDAGVSTRGIKKTTGKSTTFSIEYDDAGKAYYTSYAFNVGVHIRSEDIPRDYLKARVFHLAPMAATKQQHIIDFLRENTEAKISMNTHIGYFHRYRKKLIQLIPRVDVFTLNDEEAKTLTRESTLNRSINAFKKIPHNQIIITTGPGSSILLEDGEISISHSQFQPRVVDLTGCGDAFAGAYISSHLRGGDPLKAASIASSVASIVASDWNFRALRGLRFSSLDSFQKYVVARQRRLGKRQRSIEHFL